MKFVLSAALGLSMSFAASSVGATTFTVEQFLRGSEFDTSLSAMKAYADSTPADAIVQTQVIDYTDDFPHGSAGVFEGVNPWPVAEANGSSGRNASDNSYFFVRITADFFVPEADTYTFRTFNDDGLFLSIDDNLVIEDAFAHQEREFTGEATLSAGNHSLEIFYFELLGESALEFSFADSSGVFMQTAGNVAPVPAPAAVWLLLSGLAGFGALRLKRRPS